MGIFFAILSSLSMAGLNIVLRLGKDDLSNSKAFFVDSIFGILIWIPFSLILGINFDNIQITIIYALISAILSEALYFYTLSLGELSITSTLLASYPIYTVVFSILFNGEVLQKKEIFAVLITIIGTIIITFPKKITKKSLKNKKAKIFGVLTAVGIGFSDTLSKGVIEKTSLQDFLFSLAIAQLPIALIFLKFDKVGIKSIFSKLTLKRNYPSFIGSILAVVCVLFLFIAFSKIPASIASPITATYPVIVVLGAKILFNEKLTTKRFFGIGLVTLGILILSII